MRVTVLIFLLLPSTLLADAFFQSPISWIENPPPIRRQHISIMLGNNFLNQKDDGLTHQIGITYNLLLEDDHNILELSLFASSALKAHFTGEISKFGEREQFPKEESTATLQLKFGRALQYNFGLTISYTSFSVRGLEVLATNQQVFFHKITSNRAIKNLDADQSNELSLFSLIGIGFETSLFTEWILLQSDIAASVGLVNIEDSYFTMNAKLTVAANKITDGDISWLAFSTTFKVTKGWDDVNSSILFALSLTIPMSKAVQISLEPSVEIPLIYSEDFYNANPGDAFYRISIGFVF